MIREPFDLLQFPLDGLRLIEASAGTGKTFSLAGLYLRLLVEKQLDVRDILVITFTRAATQELRERIRIRLATAAQIAADPANAVPGNQEHEIALAIINKAAHGEPRTRITRRLRDAAARMDDATISTIHAFAQQAAQENAFDSGLPFDRGTQVDDTAIQHEAITDYWRSQVFGQSRLQATAFLELWPTPAQLEHDLRPALQKPHLELWNPEGNQLGVLTANTRKLWSQQKQNLESLLNKAMDNDALLKQSVLRENIEDAGGETQLMAKLEAGLAGTASGFPALPSWLAELATVELIGSQFKKDKKSKNYSLYKPQDPSLLLALASLTPVARVAATNVALTEVRNNIRKRKRAGRQFSFADMIESLHEAITDPDRGEALAAALHRTWPYALVDEFQDTDPLQYEILRTTYRNRASGALVMIGDPKQAIYAFRGGDVFAYLQAAHDADGCYSLDTNYRSTQGVLNSIKSLFLGATRQTQQGPFLIPQISFHPVGCGRVPGDRVIVRNGSPIPSLTAWVIEESGLTAEQGRRRLLDATVSEISCLLEADTGARVQHSDGTEAPVRPGDIAVLVNSNREAASLQRALARHGIAAVCLHRESVFESEEARDLLLVLSAADSTARLPAIRAALRGPLLGLRMAELLALAEDDTAWQVWITRFQGAHEDWRTRGVLALLEPMLQDAAPRLLALDDGERRMTNYLQLGELLAEAETRTFGSTGLIRWLAEQIDDPAGETVSDARQLRLESDDALVRIATIHKVKGLQYPIVFVPFTPSLGAKPFDSPWVFHDAASHAWLDFGLHGETKKSHAMLEARAESLRLLYVALTRAEQACYIGWGAIKSAQNSALAWLLHSEDGVDPEMIAANNAGIPDWLNTACVNTRLATFAEQAAGAVRITPLPAPLAETWRALPGPAPDGHARADLPARRPDWSVFSFSRLVAGGKQQIRGTGADDESRDPPPNSQPAIEGAEIAPRGITLRGAAFGVAVHQILEAIDPSTWPEAGTSPEQQLIARHLRNSGAPLGDGEARDALLDAVSDMISHTLFTPLPHIGPLAHVPAERRLVEMEFFLRLGGERTGNLLDFMAAHGYGLGLSRERRQQALNGLMQGFVDLTVEADGRYWIIDYKTNDLGALAEDYSPDKLLRAVRHGHYDLQYLIYLVALHRHLQRTRPDYDPDHHLGGAVYLFLRGMNGTNTQTGVFIDRPPTEFILGLDELFSRSSGEP